MKATIVVLACLLAYATCSKPSFQPGFKLDTSSGFKQDIFSNIIDHFNDDVGLYPQRFWYNAEHFDQKTGPIFLYICGEYECGVNEQRQFPVEVSKEHNGLFVYLEHRYYGASHPFDNLETENLRYLTSRHALADIAVFLSTLNDLIVQVNGGEKRKIIVVGGSYPGALSAWFRAKYPHIADASWASSAVVNAIEDLELYDWQIFNSTSRSDAHTCTETIQSMTEYLDELLSGQDSTVLEEVKAAFKANTLTNGDFAFYIADIFVGEVQYGKRTRLCEFLATLVELEDIEKFYKLAEKYYDPEDNKSYYDRHLMAKTEVIVPDSSRAWAYQYCTEFGFFQTTYEGIHMRSEHLARAYWDQRCNEIFGKEIIAQARETNVEFGALKVKGTNTFYTNGGEDPWIWAGVFDDNDALNQKARLLQCENCGHCVELYNEEESDSEELRAVRKEIKDWLDAILYTN
ncbi:unnamed protein product [Moneuplotes crassus]|uniref:Uncharacterized protein n=1 Tax=Euplotes crassus TaxID=5936 RepID=A0AAD1XEU2_EUPCR|nr:unnamed protein product [Moneuplotes crassus]